MMTHQINLNEYLALDLTRGALKRAQDVVSSLGASGRKEIGGNAFGQRMLRADWEAEEAVIAFLKEKNVPVRLYTEEHGIVDIVERPQHTALLDGLDGSAIYKGGHRELYEGRDLQRHFSTMLGFFAGMDPALGNYLACGWLDHATGVSYHARKGGGAYAGIGERTWPLQCRQEGSAKLIYLESSLPMLTERYGKARAGCSIEGLFAANAYFIDLVDPKSARTADAVIHCSAKGGLECAIAYGVVREAGGAMIDEHGRDLGEMKYLFYSSEPIKPVIAASSEVLAREIAAAI